MRVPRDMIPDRRDFFETSETRRSPKGILEADLMSQPIERTQNFCRSARKFRWFNRLKQIFGPPRANPQLRLVQKCLLMKETKLITFMNFTLTVKNGTHDVVSIFPGDEFVLCDSLFGAELRISLILEIREDFLYELTTGASVPLGVAAENLAKSSKLGGKNSCQRCANSLTLTRIPLTIPKGR